MVQDPVHIDVPLHAVAVSLVRRGVPLIRGAVPAISRSVTLVRQPVTLTGCPIPLAHPALSLIRSRFVNPYSGSGPRATGEPTREEAGPAASLTGAPPA